MSNHSAPIAVTWLAVLTCTSTTLPSGGVLLNCALSSRSALSISLRSCTCTMRNTQPRGCMRIPPAFLAPPPPSFDDSCSQHIAPLHWWVAAVQSAKAQPEVGPSCRYLGLESFPLQPVLLAEAAPHTIAHACGCNTNQMDLSSYSLWFCISSLSCPHEFQCTTSMMCIPGH